MLRLEPLRRDLLYLKDAIKYTERAIDYVSNVDIQYLPADPMRFDAVLRSLQIIGEAVKQMPDEMRELRPDIPWAKITGIRNILVHHYFGIDSDIVIDVCTNHLQPLLAALQEIARAYPEI